MNLLPNKYVYLRKDWSYNFVIFKQFVKITGYRNQLDFIIERTINWTFYYVLPKGL